MYIATFGRSVVVLRTILASNNGVDVHKYKILHIKNIVHNLTLFLYKMS